MERSFSCFIRHDPQPIELPPPRRYLYLILKSIKIQINRCKFNKVYISALAFINIAYIQKLQRPMHE